LIPILQESGGRFSDWKGNVAIDGGDAVSSNGALHDAILTRLAAHV
jgi:histidinol-phosphatase